MFTDADNKFMKIALNEASKGLGFTNPNPMVGAVIAKDGKVISKGYHHECGMPHAERDALANVKNNVSTENSTMYVTLEPCCHYGKTPPCTDAIIDAKISRVICAMSDPNPKVSGKGLEILRENGIDVEVGLLEDEARRLNEFFLTRQMKKRPFVALKIAQTLDGKTASHNGKSKWITGEKARNHGHFLRHKYMGILVGINTVISDDPMLNCRFDESLCENLYNDYELLKQDRTRFSLRNPVRIILDSNLSLPLDSKIVKTSAEIKTIVITSREFSSSAENKEKIKDLKELQVSILAVSLNENGKIDLAEALGQLALPPYEIDSILVEGGASVHDSFLREKLADYVHIYTAPKLLGGRNALSSISGIGFDDPNNCPNIKIVDTFQIDQDIYTEGSIEYQKKDK